MTATAPHDSRGPHDADAHRNPHAASSPVSESVVRATPDGPTAPDEPVVVQDPVVVQERVTIEDRVTVDDLRVALARGEFTLLYQPAFDLRRGTFAGVEALLRWRHPTRGLLTPPDFVDALATSGLIVPVGRWVLDEVTRQGARWHDRGHRFALALNVARAQVASPTFVDEVGNALRTHALAPAALTLEFASATLEELDEAARTALLALGVRLGVDDVVPGVTNVMSLVARGASVLKLARDAVTDPSRGAAIAETVSALSTRDVRVVALGVESPATARRLEGALDGTLDGAVEGQGFLYARPLAVDELDELLEDFAIFSGEPL